MSHYTVLVIGKDPEKQLEPFFENWNCDKYKVGPVEHEEMDRFRKHFIKEFHASKKLSFDEMYEKYGEEWNGRIWEKDENGEWCEYSTYNKLSKWDWYQLGGRWRGFFKLKPNRKGKLGESGAGDNKPEYDADQALKKDIDFEYMIDTSKDIARKRYNKAMCIIGNYPLIKTWKDFMEDIDKGNITIEEARIYYNDQERIKKAREFCSKNVEEGREIFGWDIDVEDFNMSKLEYVTIKGLSSIVTHAVIKEGEWYEEGRMGWWGCVHDKKDVSKWQKEFYDLIKSLPDNTLFSVYDCHI